MDVVCAALESRMGAAHVVPAGGDGGGRRGHLGGAKPTHVEGRYANVVSLSL